MSPGAIVPATTRRLLSGWLGLSVASLVVAGVFAALAAFTRTPAVQLLPSARLFHLALVSHVTFAFTVWFVTFAGTLWVYAAWRAGYPLAAGPSWVALALAAAGSAAMALPAVLADGTPHLSDYVPVIDHPGFWVGLALVTGGVALQAVAYLVARARGRTGAGSEPPEALAMAVGAVAALLAVVTLLLALARTHAELPFGYALRVVVWGPGHLLQFLHVAGMAAVWFVAGAIAVGAGPPAGRTLGWLFRTLVAFVAGTAAAYVVWPPEALLRNHVVTVLTFGGLGAAGVPIALMALAGWRRPPGAGLPWSSPLCSGSLLSVALFGVGGVLGVIGFSQDTRVPAHYHGMVGAVTLAYMGLAPLLLELGGRRPWSARLTRWQPYLYGLGLLGLMAGMHWAGGRGAPRKTFGFNWADAQALLALNLMGAGSLLAILGGLAFVVNVGWPLLRRARPEPAGGTRVAREVPSCSLPTSSR
jgi:hypothetical protein